MLVLAGIASSLLARRFGAPLLLVFLALGLLLGVDGPGGIRYSDTRFTYLVGSLALCVILFDGGLHTRAAQVRGSVAPSLVLATVGVAATAALTGLAAHWLLQLPPLQSLLLGAVLASTDAAAVLFLLRAGGLHLERRTNSTLENVIVKGDLILADGVSAASLKNVTVTGRLVVRGGTDGVKLTKSTAKGGIQLANPNGTPKLTIDGKAYDPNGTTNGGASNSGGGSSSGGGS